MYLVPMLNKNGSLQNSTHLSVIPITQIFHRSTSMCTVHFVFASLGEPFQTIGKIYYLTLTISLQIAMSEEGEITVLTHASTKSNSLRTTFPISIARQFKLKEGDRLMWTLRAENNKLVIVVNPIRVNDHE